MTIEDVQHLLRNSVHDCATVFIDSSKRDYLHYPTPAEYVIDLMEPVKNVFGIDVLDAAIANCMYNVDYNNRLVVVIGIANTDSCTALQAARAACVTTGLTADGIDELWDRADLAALNYEFYALGFASPLNGWLSDPTRTTYTICVVDADIAASGINGALVHPAPASAAELLADANAIAGATVWSYALIQTRVVGVPMLCTTSTAAARRQGWLKFGGAFYMPSPTVSPDVAAALATAFAAPGGFAIQLSSSSEATPSWTTGSLYDVITYAAVQMTSAQLSDLASTVPTLLQFSFAPVPIEVGNYSGLGQLQSSVQDAFATSFVTNGITVDATSISGITKQGILRFDAGRTNRFMIATVNSSAASVLGFDLETSLSVNQRPRSKRTFGAVQVGGQPVPLYCSVLSKNSQLLDAPGLVNLLGVRYISLRCPEVEQYMCTTGKYGPFSVGIGVFKLASTNEVGQVRFDYVSLVHKPFHPIGKLQRFTLRFELPDGSLYDFKGINNQLLLSLKYYTPTPAGSTAAGAGAAGVGGDRVVSTLNPDYDPDFSAYMARQTGFAPRLDDQGYDPYDEDDDAEDDDEEEDDDGRGRHGGADNADDGFGDDGNRNVALSEFGADVQRRVLAAESRAWRRID